MVYIEVSKKNKFIIACFISSIQDFVKLFIEPISFTYG